jgi:hypothetical protein
VQKAPVAGFWSFVEAAAAYSAILLMAFLASRMWSLDGASPRHKRLQSRRVLALVSRKSICRERIGASTARHGSCRQLVGAMRHELRSGGPRELRVV